jgi:hypothetical protein
MDGIWTWLAVVAAGALHGANPAAGWVFAACAPRSGGRAPALRPLASIALGHLASVAIVAAAVPAALRFGVEFNALVLQGLAVALLVVLAVHRWRTRAPRQRWTPGGKAGLALWSFIMATAHGAGWMLVPALVPLCTSGMPAREITASGSVLLALAAVGLHLAAMLATTGLAAWGARRGLAAMGRWLLARPSAAAAGGLQRSRPATHARPG